MNTFLPTVLGVLALKVVPPRGGAAPLSMRRPPPILLKIFLQTLYNVIDYQNYHHKWRELKGGKVESVYGDLSIKTTRV